MQEIGPHGVERPVASILSWRLIVDDFQGPPFVEPWLCGWCVRSWSRHDVMSLEVQARVAGKKYVSLNWRFPQMNHRSEATSNKNFVEMSWDPLEQFVGSEPLKQLWICQVSGVAGHLCHLSLGAGRGFWRVAEIKKDMVGRIETDLIKLVGLFLTNMKVMIWYEGKYCSNRILV